MASSSSSSSGSGSGRLWVERDVKLFDAIPSEKHLHYTVRALLWTMVEYTTLLSSEGLVTGSYCMPTENLSDEEAEAYSLPKAFGNKRQNSRDADDIGGEKKNSKKQKILSYNNVIGGQQTNNFFKASYINYMKRTSKNNVGPCNVIRRLLELDNTFDGNIHIYSENIFLVNSLLDGKECWVQILGLVDPQVGEVLVRRIGGFIDLQRMVMRRQDLINMASYGENIVPILNRLLDTDVEESISLEKAPPYVLQKYFDQRYRLFRRYDEGISLDEESWYSVTPEAVSQHIADYVLNLNGGHRFGGIIELFCGCGGNTIPLATISDFVLAVDHDVDKLTRLVNNSTLYGVASRILPVACDVNCLLKEERLLRGAKSKFDLLLMSPPWGGPNYLDGGDFNIKTGFPCGDGYDLIIQSFRLCANIVCVLPKNVDIKQLLKIQRLLSGVSCRLERVHLHNKHKLTIFYIGDNINK